jgi:glycosyltransferase involved in cell wall biosynthesis
MQKKYQIVMFSMSSYNEWQSGVQNRNYHILQNLIKNERVEKVVSIDYLPHTWRRFYKNWQTNVFKKTKLPARRKGLFGKIFEVNDKLTIYSSVTSKISPNKFYQELNDYLLKNNFQDYLVWSYYPLDVNYFEKLAAKFYLFDAVDNWAEHPSYRHLKKTLLTNYKIIDQKANLIFTVSSDLQKLFENHQKVYWIPNGVDLKHYQRRYLIINRDIGEIKRPIIGYIGTIQDRLDVDLVEYLAVNNPDKSVVMIGPVWYVAIEERLKKQPNIHFLGKKPYEEVPMYLQQFDLGIIPHKVDKFVKSTNPMKVYEYLACQKPVVATKGGDLEIFKDLIYLTDDYQQFNRCLNEALSQDNDQLRQRRLEAVKEHSWVKRVEDMLNLIEQKYEGF